MSIDTLAGAPHADAPRADAPRADRARGTTGATLWFTGLPSAGKSTIAHALADRLTADGIAVEVLDGDVVRPHLSAGLGYTRADRDINVTRIGWVARLLAGHGVVVLVPVIAPYADARNTVRADHAENDVKGLYGKARAGEISGMTGVDDPYEQPATAELTIDTAAVPLPDSVAQAYALLADLRRLSGGTHE